MLLQLAIGLLLQFHDASASTPSLSPEQETAKIAATLKSISNEEWTSIAGERIKEQYDVSKGDTLYDISKRLFGDNKYWPKIWSLNNGRITNPHLLQPGDKIAFQGGSETSLPSVNMNNTETATDASSVTSSDYSGDNIVAKASKPRTDEWRELPRQPWETVDLTLPPHIDPYGFDKRNKINFRKSTGFELKAIAATEEIQFLGEITAARVPQTLLGLRDIVYIKASSEIQVGERYTITQDPTTIRSEKSGRIGYSYVNLGTIKIIGVREDVFIGIIITSKFPIARGDRLIPYVTRVKEYQPKAGPEPMEAVMLVDRKIASTYTTAQHKQVIIDRGIQDGIEPGMIFRAYQYYDPKTNDKILSSDFVIDADFMIVQTSEQFSSAMVITSNRTVDEGATVVLLTDVSSLSKKSPIDAFQDDSRHDRDTELDDLDSLDPGGGMTPEEKKELNQLEKWEEGKEPPATNDGTKAPEDEILDDVDLEEPPAAEPPAAETPKVEAPKTETTQPEAEKAPPPPAEEKKPDDKAFKDDDSLFEEDIEEEEQP